jgi:hypothetical protein
LKQPGFLVILVRIGFNFKTCFSISTNAIHKKDYRFSVDFFKKFFLKKTG